MMKRYGSLHNLPYHQQPVMVHQIPRFMAVERNRKKLAKIALLVLDGLAFDQWLLLRKSLEACDKAWRFQESTAFAWVPTLTSVTRQSIFAGEPPLYFPDSLETTSKERAHWLRFWEDQGVQRPGVDLVTNLDGPAIRSWRRRWRTLGCPSWGSSGTRSMTSCTGCRCRRQGCTTKCGCGLRRATLQQLLARLHSEGFAVYLTADHGNVTATGIGNPKEGVLVETKGKRARVYDRPEFLEEVATKFPESMRWPDHGLPPARHVLLAGDLKAFTDEGDEDRVPRRHRPGRSHGPVRGDHQGGRMRKVVGIDRKIKRAWLDAVLDRLAQTTDEAELRTFLDEHPEGRTAGQGVKGQDRRASSCESGAASRRACALRDRAVALLPRSPARSASGCIGA